MGAETKTWCLVGLVCLMVAGFTEAAHLTKPVPLPEGVTIWDVCGMTVDHIKYEYDQCNQETERYVAEHGSGMAAQCKVIELFNNCMIYNVSLHCPDVYRQYYSQMGAYAATVIMFCGSTMGLISIEEFEHIAWDDFAMHYFEWLERTTAAPFINVTEVTTAADVSINEPVSSGNVTAEGGVNETVSGANVTSNATQDSVDANATISDGNVTTDLTSNVTKDEDDVMAVDRDADDAVTSGDGEMITGKMEEVVKAVTERFLAATKEPETKPTPTKKMSLMDVLTTAAPQV